MVNSNYSDSGLEQIMRKEFDNARATYYYPALPMPTLVDDKSNGYIDLEKLKIKVSSNFIRGFEQYGLTPEETLNEVMTHEITHFMKYPGSPLTLLRLEKAAKDSGLRDRDKIEKFKAHFIEAQTNLDMLTQIKHPTTAKMRKAYGLPGDDGFGKLMYGLYQEVSGQDFGVHLDSEELEFVNKLKNINYLDKNQECRNFNLFSKILSGYIPKKQPGGNGNEKNMQLVAIPSPNGAKAKGLGGLISKMLGKGENGDSSPPDKKEKSDSEKNNKSYDNKKGDTKNNNGDKDSKKEKGNHEESLDCHGSSMKMFSEDQIKDALKSFADECNSPQEYEDIVKSVLSQYQKDMKDAHPELSGPNAGISRSISLFADNFYSAMAEKYAIPIKKREIEKMGGLYPHSHNSFELGDPLTDIDSFSTPGILPGITKKWIRKEGEGFSQEENIPNNFIIIDNSPSMFGRNRVLVKGFSELEDLGIRMKNRKQELSLFSTRFNSSDVEFTGIYTFILGATAIANAYLLNNAKVAVYSFGGSDHLTNFSSDRNVIHQELRRVSKGGGTTFDAGFLERILEQYTEPFDITVISDMEISNVGEFSEGLLKVPALHRLHFFYANENSYVEQIRSSFGKLPNVGIAPLLCEEDITSLIMGELKKSIKYGE